MQFIDSFKKQLRTDGPIYAIIIFRFTALNLFMALVSCLSRNRSAVEIHFQMCKHCLFIHDKDKEG